MGLTLATTNLTLVKSADRNVGDTADRNVCATKARAPNTHPARQNIPASLLLRSCQRLINIRLNVARIFKPNGQPHVIGSNARGRLLFFAQLLMRG